MLRILQKFILTLVLALFASHASAMFIQPDWFEPTESGVGTNRYSYSNNDPVNRFDPGGNQDGFAMMPAMRAQSLTEQGYTPAEAQSIIAGELAKQEMGGALGAVGLGAMVFAPEAGAAAMIRLMTRTPSGFVAGSMEIAFAEATGMYTVTKLGVDGATKFTMHQNKFNYLFGRVTSNPHNEARSTQLGAQMERLGFEPTEAGRGQLVGFFGKLLDQTDNIVKTETRVGSDGLSRTMQTRFGAVSGPSGVSMNANVVYEVTPAGHKFVSSILYE